MYFVVCVSILFVLFILLHNVDICLYFIVYDGGVFVSVSIIVFIDLLVPGVVAMVTKTQFLSSSLGISENAVNEIEKNQVVKWAP